MGKWDDENGNRLPCHEDDCENPILVSGLCRAHYLKAYKKKEHPKTLSWTNEDGSRMLCNHAECDLPIKSRGLCSKHYQAAVNSNRPKKGFRQTKWMNPDGTRMICLQEGCTNLIKTSGLCSPHYSESYRKGTDREAKPVTYCPVPGCDRVKAYRAAICGRCNQKRWRFGLDYARYMEMMQPENRKCGNVGCSNDYTTSNLHIDHDHDCCPPGKFSTKTTVSCGACVRGWLCQACNTSLGLLKEDPQRISGLLEWIAR